ncbi:MAG: helix-turn-helix domain-containing protein, partial [Devosia sp.]
EDGMPVGKLQTKLDIPGSTLSHHLRQLLDAQLVKQERQATTLICRANYTVMHGLIGFLQDECCEDVSEHQTTAAACDCEDTEAA